MNRDKLRSLIRLVEESEIDELEIRRWGRTVRITKRSTRSRSSAGGDAQLVDARPKPEATTAPPESSAGPSTDTGHYQITSPMVGTFYRAPSPEAPPFVEIGDTVRTGQTLCILEAMKLMNELESEVSGIVRKVLVENSEPVEYGQPLFEIETT